MKAREHTAQLHVGRGGGRPAAVRARRGERAVLLDDVRAGRGRRRAAVGGDAEHAADHSELRAAGRARRAADDSAALVVTYAQRRSHDLSRFQDPKIDGGRRGAVAVRAAWQRADRPAARALGGAGGVLPGSEGADRGDVDHGGRVLPRDAGARQRACGRTFRRCRRRSRSRCGECCLRTCSGRSASRPARGRKSCASLLEDVRAELAADVALFEERRQQAYRGPQRVTSSSCMSGRSTR